MEKTKKTLVVLLFFLTVFGFSVGHLCLPDREVSASERRYLETFPELTAKSVFSGRFFTELDKYLLDQFPLREEFRTVKAVTELYLLDMGETSGITRTQGHLAAAEEVCDPEQVALGAEKFRDILMEHLDGEAYFALVPTKNQFLTDGSVTAPDMEAMEAQLRERLYVHYVDLMPVLELSDYYTTDSHWRQECLLPAAQLLCRELGVPVMPETAYTAVECGSFAGVYAGQSALPVKQEPMRYLMGPGTENAVVTSLETGEIPMHDPQAVEHTDPYDVFLGGAQALVTIENPEAASDRHLVIFRDSFGSSLAPLLAGSWSRITLVDLRYMSSALLEQYVDFENADILFLYSTSILNSASVLK